MKIIFATIIILTSLAFAAIWTGLIGYGRGMSGGSTSISSYSQFTIVAPYLYLFAISFVSFFDFRWGTYIAVCSSIIAAVIFSFLLPHDGAFRDKLIVTSITIAIPSIWALIYLFFAYESDESNNNERQNQEADAHSARPC